MPDLTPEEYAALKEDIRRNGVLVPIEKDEHGNILDGHHRERIWRELEAEGVRHAYPKVLIQPGLSEEAKRDLVLGVNLARRHLTREQRQELHVRLRQQGLSTREIA